MLILASASPRRRELLTQAGLAFTVHPPTSTKHRCPARPPPPTSSASPSKRPRPSAPLSSHTAADPLTVLAADTAVVLQDGSILGKPANPAAAAGMLSLLSGRTHAVMTGLAAVTPTAHLRRRRDHPGHRRTSSRLAEIDAYVATGEPLDKAGAYAIQGYAARWIPASKATTSTSSACPSPAWFRSWQASNRLQAAHLADQELSVFFDPEQS